MASRMTVVVHRCSPTEMDTLVQNFVRHTDLWEGDGFWSINSLLDVPPASRLVRPAATPGPARASDEPLRCGSWARSRRSGRSSSGERPSAALRGPSPRRPIDCRASRQKRQALVFSVSRFQRRRRSRAFSEPIAFLATMFSRFSRFQRRCRSPAFSVSATPSLPGHAIP